MNNQSEYIPSGGIGEMYLDRIISTGIDVNQQNTLRRK